MNPKLIQFIELCLVDGVISDKEREVIFRKSKDLGVPDDECEIILEGMVRRNKLLQKDSVKKGQIIHSRENNSDENNQGRIKKDSLTLEKREENISKKGNLPPIGINTEFIEKEGVTPSDVNKSPISIEDSELIKEIEKTVGVILEKYSSEISLLSKDRIKTQKELKKNDLFFIQGNDFKKLDQNEKFEILDSDEKNSFEVYYNRKTGWYFTTDGKLIIDLRKSNFFTGENRWSNEVSSIYWIMECYSGNNIFVPKVFESNRWFKRIFLIPVGDDLFIQIPSGQLDYVDEILLGFETYLNNQLKFSPILEDLEFKLGNNSSHFELIKMRLELMKTFILKYHSNFIIEINKYVDDSLLLIKKYQSKIKEDKYVHNLVQMTNRLKDIREGLNTMKKLIISFDLVKIETSNRRGIILPNEDEKIDLDELISEFEDGVDNYTKINFYTLCMITSLLENDKMTFLQIYEQFDKIGVFNSNWENLMLEGINNLNKNMNELTNSVYLLNYSVSRKLDKLHYLTESSFEGLKHSITTELKGINSSINFNNLLTGIQSYQLYKINKNTKSLRG